MVRGYSILLFLFPIFAAVILAYLLLPGVLLTSKGEVSASERNLTQYARELREFAEGDVCSVRDLPPPAILPEGQADTQARPFRPIPVDPNVTPVPQEASPTRADRSGSREGNPDGAREPDGTEEPLTLAELMKGAVVFIGNEKASGRSGHGTGFVVDKRHIVTNHHVVEDAERLFALNGGSNGPVELSVVEVVAGSGMARSDLALLRSEDDLNLPAFAVVPFPSEMDPVFAAGYPGAVLDTDENYRRLLQGDLGAIPGIVITNGRVSAIQNRDKPHSLLVHSAEISPGNSGGPLVDECGRVVGINTFLTNPTEGNPGNRAVYYSQPIARMLDAFGDTGVEFRVLEGICGSATAQQVHAGPAPDAQTDGE